MAWMRRAALWDRGRSPPFLAPRRPRVGREMTVDVRERLPTFGRPSMRMRRLWSHRDIPAWRVLICRRIRRVDRTGTPPAYQRRRRTTRHSSGERAPEERSVSLDERAGKRGRRSIVPLSSHALSCARFLRISSCFVHHRNGQGAFHAAMGTRFSISCGRKGLLTRGMPPKCGGS